MRALIITAAAVTLAALAASAVAQHPAAHPAQASPAEQAFEHYEGIRVALSADRLRGIAPHAKQLAASVEATGAAEARAAAHALAAATSLDEARKHFGVLSTILVPKFQAAGIEGANAYFCAMKKLSWMQRGDSIENPYYGKSMLACGEPLPASGR
jgi:membrane fusion protein, copper/silver efflux system